MPALRRICADGSTRTRATPRCGSTAPSDNLRVSEFVTDRLPGRARTLITTRLDNDDTVASDFVARIQHAARGEDRLYINFPFGYQWENGRIYYYMHFANPFLSLVERLPRGRSAHDRR
jgi:hypothetical protein